MKGHRGELGEVIQIVQAAFGGVRRTAGTTTAETSFGVYTGPARVYGAGPRLQSKQSVGFALEKNYLVAGI